MTHVHERPTVGEIVIDRRGRVTIPAPVRHAAGIEPGTPLTVTRKAAG